MDRMAGVRSPEESRYFVSSQRPNRIWGPLNLLSNGYRACFPGGKVAGREANHPLLPSAEVKDGNNYMSTPP
jgi:hypothetical protein